MLSRGRDATLLALAIISCSRSLYASTESFLLDETTTDAGSELFGSEMAFPLGWDEAAHTEPFRSFPCLPKHIHLAQASNVNANDGLYSVTVSFSLNYESCRHGTPRVFYGLEDGLSPSKSVVGSHPLQFNYTSDESDGLYQSDWIYHIELPSLQAGLQKYWYRIVVEESTITTRTTTLTSTHRSLRGSNGYYLGETKTYTFATQPLPGSPTSLALVGDIGQTENSVRTLLGVYQLAHEPVDDDEDTEHHRRRPPVSQLLVAGDMSYADADPRRWTTWLEMVAPLVRSTPLHVVAGNHEIECDTTTHDIFVPYEHWFRNPNRLGEAEMVPVSDDYRQTLWHESCTAPSNFQGIYNYGNSFYSFQHGLAHIIVLNSYSDCTEGSVQYEWLTTELRDRVNRQTTPWLLVSFHAPLYTTFLGHVNEIESLNMKRAMEPLFNKYGVNLIISGTLFGAYNYGFVCLPHACFSLRTFRA
jgi:Calcineurin-like phosphoesterase